MHGGTGWIVLQAAARTSVEGGHTHRARRDHEAYLFFPRTKAIFAGVLVDLSEPSLEPLEAECSA